MLGNFSYCNPTKLYFGENSLQYLNDELPKYGTNVMLIYGGGSIKKNGIYDQVMSILTANNKTVFEDAGVMPNPTVEKLYVGCRIAKAVSVSAYCEDAPWEKYYLKMEDVDNKIIPVGCVLTMVGTDSEMDGGYKLLNKAEIADILKATPHNYRPSGFVGVYLQIFRHFCPKSPHRRQPYSSILGRVERSSTR